MKDLEKYIDSIDITAEAPVNDPQRQYYYIKKAREYVKQASLEAGRPLTFCVTTFGCQMNARDSEKLVGVLEQIGYQEEADEDKADFVIYNTCTVRENANMRVYGRLGQLKHAKKMNPHMMIGLCGCMMQEPHVVEKLKTSYRFVDLIFGTHNIYKFAELIATRYESKRMVIDIWKDTDQIVEDLPSERKFFFKSGQAALVIRNTVLYNILFIIVGTATQIAVAVFLTEIRGKRFRKVSQSMMFLPYFISWVIVGVMAFNIFSSDYGFINRILVSLGAEKYAFYKEPSAWPFILLFFNIWKGVGYGSVMYLAAIMGVDTSIYEAAAIDGANVFQRIFKVTIPSIMPTVIILFLMSIGGIFKGNFDMFYNLVGGNGLLYNATDVIDTLAFRALISSNDFGMSAAIGLFQSVLCFITVLLANKLVSLYDKDYTLF